MTGYARRTGELFDRLKTISAVERRPTDLIYVAMAYHRLALRGVNSARRRKR